MSRTFFIKITKRQHSQNFFLDWVSRQHYFLNQTIRFHLCLLAGGVIGDPRHVVQKKMAIKALGVVCCRSGQMSNLSWAPIILMSVPPGLAVLVKVAEVCDAENKSL